MISPHKFHRFSMTCYQEFPFSCKSEFKKNTCTKNCIGPAITHFSWISEKKVCVYLSWDELNEDSVWDRRAGLWVRGEFGKYELGMLPRQLADRHGPDMELRLSMRVMNLRNFRISWTLFILSSLMSLDWMGTRGGPTRFLVTTSFITWDFRVGNSFFIVFVQSKWARGYLSFFLKLFYNQSWHDTYM